MFTSSLFQRPVQRLTVCALLVALSVLLAGLLKIPINVFGAYSVKLSFGVIPVYLAAILFGPLYGGMVGGMADFLQAILFPVGGFNPLFTLTGILFGVIPALFFRKQQQPTFLRLLLTVAVTQISCSVVLNSIFLTISYGTPILIAGIRAVQQLIFIPIFAVVLYLLLQAFNKLLKRAA